MSRKNITTVGFMLFAMFFGAGNLIFPLALGYQAGEHLLMAVIGFIVTGVGLPLFGMGVGALTGKGYRQSLNEIHPIFSLVFLSAIYLSIGPFFAIPRTGTTAYEIGLVPFLQDANQWSLILFSAAFFGISLWIAVKPSKISSLIGDYLTPVLLIAIVLLVLRSVTLFWESPVSQVDVSNYQTAPLATGFLEGYLTMDTLASLAFSMIVINAIRVYQTASDAEVTKGTFYASLIAAGLLAFIYGMLAWIGNHTVIDFSQLGNQNLGAFLLVKVAEQGFGSWGVVLIAVIVFLACLTTSSGLIAAVAEYFESIYPKVSYSIYAVIFTIISFLIANQGLEQVIQTSVPILSILYPISMAIIVIVFLNQWIYFNRSTLLIPILLVSGLSILAVVHRQGIIKIPFLLRLPLMSNQLEWLPFLIGGLVISYLLSKMMDA